MQTTHIDAAAVCGRPASCLRTRAAAAAAALTCPSPHPLTHVEIVWEHGALTSVTTSPDVPCVEHAARERYAVALTTHSTCNAPSPSAARGGTVMLGRVALAEIALFGLLADLWATAESQRRASARTAVQRAEIAVERIGTRAPVADPGRHPFESAADYETALAAAEGRLAWEAYRRRIGDRMVTSFLALQNRTCDPSPPRPAPPAAAPSQSQALGRRRAADPAFVARVSRFSAPPPGSGRARQARSLRRAASIAGAYTALLTADLPSVAVHRPPNSASPGQRMIRAASVAGATDQVVAERVLGPLAVEGAGDVTVAVHTGPVAVVLLCGKPRDREASDARSRRTFSRTPRNSPRQKWGCGLPAAASDSRSCSTVH